jgi:hypothetical protein
MPRRAALVLAVTLLSLPAGAELLEVDLNAPGDKLVTRDTETGLDWLDLGGVTTNLSYDAIQGGAGGWLASGWRYATQSEVCALFVDHTEATTCNFDSGLILEPLQARNLFGLLGSTGAIVTGAMVDFIVAGLYDDGTGGAAGEARIDVLTSFPPGGVWVLRTGATPDAIPTSTASTSRGSFLVRATPPEIPALPLAALAALAASLAVAARRALAS